MNCTSLARETSTIGGIPYMMKSVQTRSKSVRPGGAAVIAELREKQKFGSGVSRSLYSNPMRYRLRSVVEAGWNLAPGTPARANAEAVHDVHGMDHLNLACLMSWHRTMPLALPHAPDGLKRVRCTLRGFSTRACRACRGVVGLDSTECNVYVCCPDSPIVHCPYI